MVASRSNGDYRDYERPGWLVAVTLLGVLVVLVVGLLFARDQERTLRSRAEDELATIAALKADEIAGWHEDRILDGQRMSLSPSIHLFVERWIEDPSPQYTDELRRLLYSLRFAGRYRDVVLISTDGRPLVRASADFAEDGHMHPYVLDALAEALVERRSVLTDLHSMPDDTDAHFDVVTPIYEDADPEVGEPIGTIILQAHAEDFLYPLIASWPTPSETAETLLVRRDGETALFLNDLRHIEEAALSLRIPLEETDNPAVRAILGESGVIEGVDYRGEEVLAYLAPISDSGWYLVAKIDAAEAFAGLRARSGLILGLSLALMVAIVTSAGLADRQMRSAHYALRLHLEQAEGRARERLVATMRSIGDGVISVDAGRRVEFMNPVAEELTGWPLAEAAGRPLDEVFPIINETSRSAVENPVDQVFREGVIVGLANHTILISRDGTERPIADSAAPIHDSTGSITGVVLVFRDQTEERAARAALAQSEERFRSLVEGAPDAIFVQTERRFAYVNEAMCRLLGAASPDDLLGTLVLDRVQEEYRQVARDRIGALNEGRVPQAARHMVFIRLDGTEVHVETSGMPIVYDGIEGALVFVRDITERMAAQEELAYSHELLSYIIEHDRTAVAVLDTEMRHIYASKRFQEDYGVVESDIIGKSHYEVFPEIPERWREVHARALAGAVLSAEEDRFVREDGTVDWTSWECRPWHEKDGSIGGIILYTEVINERVEAQRALRESEELLRLAGELAGLGGWSVDLAANRIYWSDEVAAIHETDPGFSPSVEEGIDFYAPESKERITEVYTACVLYGEPYDEELQIITATGRRRWVRTAGVPFRDEGGEIVGVRGAFQDITDRKEIEAELRRHRRHLEELVAERTADLARANAELEEATRAKSEFLASMSHELRTPLNSIIGFSGLLVQGLAGPLTAEQQTQVDMVNRSGKHLLSLIDDVLDLAKIEAGGVDTRLERFDSRDVVLDSVGTLRPLIDDTGLELEVVMPSHEVWITSDRVKLQQIVLNLLGNAVKFTDEGHVEIRLERCPDGGIALTVSDTGPGIPADMLDRVFEPFVQAESTGSTAKPQGTGLGLSISRQYARMLDGDLTVSSDPGGGATFRLTVADQA